MSEIENKGSKGWVFFGVISFLILFIITWIYVYGQNMNDVPIIG